MNPWYWVFFMLMIYGLLILIFVIFLINLIICIKNKKSKANTIKIIAADVIAAVILTLFNMSHDNYYKYNDWLTIGKDIRWIEQKYGEFDIGSVNDNKSGRVGYFIYDDEGPIMPDHLDHYYYIEYDENGIVKKVYEGSRPGG